MTLRLRTWSEPNAHEGEKWGVVLSGMIGLTLDGKTYSLREGDSFHFDSPDSASASEQDVGHRHVAHVAAVHALRRPERGRATGLVTAGARRIAAHHVGRLPPQITDY